MSIKIKFPIRYKIFFTQITVTGLVLGIFFYMVTDLLIKDKKAYIFDTLLGKTDVQSTQLKLFLSEKTHLARLVVKNIESENTLIPEIFDQHQEIFKIEVFQINEGLPIKESLTLSPRTKENYKSDLQAVLKPHKGLIDDLKQALANGVATRVATGEQTLSNFFIATYSREKNRIYGLYFNLDLILDHVFKGTQFENGLYTSDGKLAFLNSTQGLPEDRQNLYQGLATKALNTNAETSIVEAFHLSDETYFVSYAKIAQSNLMTFSAIGEKKAFQVTRLLIIRTSFFVLAIVCLLTIGSIAFAKNITNPLNELVTFTQRFADGNYKTKATVSSNDESHLLAHHFNLMAQSIRKYIAELKAYSTKLEEMVEERTRELQEAKKFIEAMINSIDQGIIVFNSKGRCTEIYTKASVQMFGLNPHKKPLFQVLRDNDAESFKDWIDGLFAENLPFEEMALVGPTEFKESDIGQNDFKHIDLRYFPMRNEKKEITYAVMVATDSTQQKISDYNFEIQKDYIRNLAKLITNKKQFIPFVKDFKRMISEVLHNIEINLAHPTQFNTALYFRYLHTIKGTCSLLGLGEIEKCVHGYEDQGKEILDHPEKIDAETLKSLSAKMMTLEELLKKFLCEYKDFLGLSALDGEERTEIKRSDLDTFINRHFQNTEDFKYQFFKTFIASNLSQEFTPFDQLIREAAEGLAKKVAPLKISGDALIDPVPYQEFLANLVHLFRNSVDHGIEFPQDRQSAGKNPIGEIEVLIADTPQCILLTIKDNGGGIDVEKIKNKLLQTRGESYVQGLTSAEIMNHIFLPNLSTRDVVTSLSGRGVGMDAVKEALEKIGGLIKVESALGQGTTFIIELPQLGTKREYIGKFFDSPDLLR